MALLSTVGGVPHAAAQDATERALGALRRAGGRMSVPELVRQLAETAGTDANVARLAIWILLDTGQADVLQSEGIEIREMEQQAT